MVLWRQRNIFDLIMTLYLLLNIMGPKRRCSIKSYALKSRYLGLRFVTRFTPLATFSTMSSISIFYCDELFKSYSCSNLIVVQIFEVPKNFRKKCAHEKPFFWAPRGVVPKKNLRKHSNRFTRVCLI